jgi:hypothetical protein
MAAIPPHLSETNRRSSSENRAALSYGRGGAGMNLPLPLITISPHLPVLQCGLLFRSQRLINE